MVTSTIIIIVLTNNGGRIIYLLHLNYFEGGVWYYSGGKVTPYLEPLGVC